MNSKIDTIQEKRKQKPVEATGMASTNINRQKATKVTRMSNPYITQKMSPEKLTKQFSHQKSKSKSSLYSTINVSNFRNTISAKDSKKRDLFGNAESENVYRDAERSPENNRQAKKTPNKHIKEPKSATMELDDNAAQVYADNPVKKPFIQESENTSTS